MIVTPHTPEEALAVEIMARILTDDLVGINVVDTDVAGDSDLLERDIQLRWSCQAIEQISSIIRDFRACQ